MDSSSYEDLTTSRGIKYHYFASNHTGAEKHTLLFLHGFPSTSYDWRHQVAFFQTQGHRLIVPDMLGYGGTDKPLDPALYRGSLMTADLIEILDAERVENAIAIGHDWGCVVVSRLASFYPERFLGFAFLSASYHCPNPEANMMTTMEAARNAAGYETCGYWLFMCEDDAASIIESHWDSFLSIMYPDDPQQWRTDMGPQGGLKAWLLANRMGRLPSYLTPEELQKTAEAVKAGGIVAPLNWYRIFGLGILEQDERNVPKENYTIKQPVFFGGASQDYICVSRLGKVTIDTYCSNATIREFNAGHWVQLELPQEVNCELLAWIMGIRG